MKITRINVAYTNRISYAMHYSNAEIPRNLQIKKVWKWYAPIEHVALQVLFN